MLTFDAQQKILSEILKRVQNSHCSDCNTKGPTWASLQFGVFLCLNCSGAHRALGPSVTRVKSAKLDMWHKDWVDLMKFGNKKINEYWQANLIPGAKPNPNSNLDDIKKYTVQKYIKKKYSSSGLDPISMRKEQTQEQKNCKNNKIDQIIKDKIKKQTTTKKIIERPQSEKKPVNTVSFDDFLKISSPSNNHQTPTTDLINFNSENQKKQTFQEFNLIQIDTQKPSAFNKTMFNSYSGNTTANSTSQHILLKKIIEKNIDHQTTYNKIDFNTNNQLHHLNHHNMNNYTHKYHPHYLPHQKHNYHANNHKQLNFSQNFYGGLQSINFNSPTTIKLTNITHGQTAQNMEGLGQKITLQVTNFQKQTSKQGASWVDDWK